MERLKKPALRVLGADITSRCDSDCAHCGSISTTGDIPTATFEKLLDSGRRVGLTDVTIAGGEPLLHPAVQELLELTYRKRLYAAILSNGTHLADAIPFLLDLPNLSYVRVSVESHDPDRLDRMRRSSGAAARVADALASLGASNIPFGVSMTVTRENLSDIAGVVDLALSHGARFVRVSPCLVPDGTAAGTPRSGRGPYAAAVDPLEIACAIVDAFAERIFALNTPYVELPGRAAGFARPFSVPCPAGQFMMSLSSDLTATLCPFTRHHVGVDVSTTRDLGAAWRELVRARATYDRSSGPSDEVNAGGRPTSPPTRRQPAAGRTCLADAVTGHEADGRPSRFDAGVIAYELYERMADRSREHRQVLASLLARQLELNAIDLNPCWRSSPLFLIPLRALPARVD